MKRCMEQISTVEHDLVLDCYREKNSLYLSVYLSSCFRDAEGVPAATTDIQPPLYDPASIIIIFTG